MKDNYVVRSEIIATVRHTCSGTDLKEFHFRDPKIWTMRHEQQSTSEKHDLSLSCLWHSRQFAVDDSPRTDTMPGAGYLAEHSEHVGTKTLWKSLTSDFFFAGINFDCGCPFWDRLPWNSGNLEIQNCQDIMWSNVDLMTFFRVQSVECALLTLVVGQRPYIHPNRNIQLELSLHA